MANRFNSSIILNYDNGESVIALLDPFDQVAAFDEPNKNADVQNYLGLIPTILTPQKGNPWTEAIRENYRATSGGICCDLTELITMNGYIWKGELDNGYQEPDLYPIAIFEHVRTGERVAFYKYALTAVFNDKNELLLATRLD